MHLTPIKQTKFIRLKRQLESNLVYKGSGNRKPIIRSPGWKSPRILDKTIVRDKCIRFSKKHTKPIHKQDIFNLDGADLPQARHFIQFSDEPPRSIHNTEINVSTYKHQKEIAKTLTSCKSCQIFNYFESLSAHFNETRTYDFVFADYFCSLDGNKSKDIHPLQDLKKILNNNKSNQFVFAITVCNRDRRRTNNKTRQQHISEDSIKIKYHISLHKYGIIDYDEYTYGNMTFRIYMLIRK